MLSLGLSLAGPFLKASVLLLEAGYTVLCALAESTLGFSINVALVLNLFFSESGYGPGAFVAGWSPIGHLHAVGGHDRDDACGYY